MSNVFAVDFDGTLVEHEYPKIGAPVPGAVEWLRFFTNRGDRLILWTMRDGARLQEAIDYCKNAGIDLWAVNANPDQGSWTSSRKAYAQRYIDDAAVGCPLIYPEGRRPYVNWDAVARLILGDEYAD